MNADPNRFKLQAAKELMQADQYEAARAVLETIADHPTAQQWLMWMDKNVSQKRKSKSRTGWRLSRVLVLVFSCSFFSYVMGFSLSRTPTPSGIVATVPTDTPLPVVTATVTPSELTATAPAPEPTNTLTDLEAVEVGIATAEAAGLPLKVIFERLDGVTDVEVVYITFWDSDTVSVEARLNAPQSIVDQLLTASMEYVPEMTVLYLTVTSPDGIRVDYTWETVNPYWRPLSMNGELLPTRAAQP